MDSLKGKRELKEKRKKEQAANVKRKEDAKETKESKAEKEKEKKEREEAKAKENDDQPKKKFFENFQKDGKIIPNITSDRKRAPGISKGMWKQEHKKQLTGKVEKKTRKGMRKPKEDDSKSVLGKRDHKSSTKTATTHSKNTSTFKSQNKKHKKE